MDRTEIAVWRVAGAEPKLGVVVAKTKSNIRTVRWDDQPESKVKPNDPVIRFAFEDSRKLEWLVDPDRFDVEFRSSPEEIFVAILRDIRGPMTAASLQKEVIHVSDDADTVKQAWTAVKAKVAHNKHVMMVGTAFQWSDEPVDPYADLRRLSPEEALQRLLKSGVKADVKEVLADVVRSGFIR